MSMFKKTASVNDEVFSEMERNLTAEEPTPTLNVEEVITSINAMAEKFESAGRVKEAEALTGLLERLAEAESQEQFEKNLLETGTLFSLQDFKGGESNASEDQNGASDGQLSIEEEDENQVEGMLSSFDDEE